MVAEMVDPAWTDGADGAGWFGDLGAAGVSSLDDPRLIWTLFEMRNRYHLALLDGGPAGAMSLVRSKRFITPLQNAIARHVVEESARLGRMLGTLPERSVPMRPQEWAQAPSAPFLATERQICDGVNTWTNQDIVVMAGRRLAMSLNVKSQMSSFGKNFHTYARIISGETAHLRRPDRRLVCGLFYLFPAESPMPREGRLPERPNFDVILDAVRYLGGRASAEGERDELDEVCALVVDFHFDDPGQDPEILSTVADFEARGLRTPSQETLDALSTDGFAERLIAKSRERYAW